MSETLLVIRVDATTERITSGYENIKRGLDGATLDFVVATTAVGAYVDDNGMLENQPLNVVASFLLARPIFGPIVLAHPEPDDEGETLGLDETRLYHYETLARQWRLVVREATRLNQDLSVFPQPDNLPPARIYAVDEFFQPIIEDSP
jgi:hypothetical protein